MTVLGPLTTTFTPASSCLASTNLWEVVTTRSTTGSSIYTAQYDLLGPPSTSDCFPPSYTEVTTAYYSPGMCPSGYSVVTQFVNTYGGTLTETTQTCCPSIGGFSFGTAPTSKTEDGYPFLSSLFCTSSYTEAHLLHLTLSSSGVITTTLKDVNTGSGINAYGIIVRFQPSDFASSSVTTTTSATSSPSAQPSSSRDLPSSPSPTSLTTSPPTSYQNGLSSGAKVGIGVGVTAGVLALALGVAVGIIIGQRKKRSNNLTEPSQHQPGHSLNKIQTPGTTDPPVVWTQWESRPLRELHDESQRYELEHSQGDELVS